MKEIWTLIWIVLIGVFLVYAGPIALVTALAWAPPLIALLVLFGIGILIIKFWR